MGRLVTSQPLKVDSSGVGRHQADDHVKARGLARAVGSEQTDDLAPAHLDVHLVDHRAALVDLHQPFRAQDGHRTRRGLVRGPRRVLVRPGGGRDLGLGFPTGPRVDGNRITHDKSRSGPFLTAGWEWSSPWRFDPAGSVLFFRSRDQRTVGSHGEQAVVAAQRHHGTRRRRNVGVAVLLDAGGALEHHVAGLVVKGGVIRAAHGALRLGTLGGGAFLDDDHMPLGDGVVDAAVGRIFRTRRRSRATGE